MLLYRSQMPINFLMDYLQCSDHVAYFDFNCDHVFVVHARVVYVRYSDGCFSHYFNRVYYVDVALFGDYEANEVVKCHYF